MVKLDFMNIQSFQLLHLFNCSSDSVTLYYLIIRLFSCKNISEIANKTFATQCFFTDHLNPKTVNKKPVERPQQILVNYGHIS